MACAVPGLPGVRWRVAAMLVGCIQAGVAAVAQSPATATQKMTARLAEEADAFRRLAPDVIGTETLVQRARKGRPRFHLRVGAAATRPPKDRWRQRTIVSEYGFSVLGDQDSVHELRQVISVDGHSVTESGKAQTMLADVIMAKDAAQEIRLLKNFEKHGLEGAATDFGQLILLFTPRNIARYEFSDEGTRMLRIASGASVAARLFTYAQIDGPAALKLFDARHGDRLHSMRIQGEVWVGANNFLPLRITIVASQGEAENTIREEAAVDYAMSKYGALLPTRTHHQELRGGSLAVENTFSYTDFRKFGASSDIRFHVKK